VAGTAAPPVAASLQDGWEKGLAAGGASPAGDRGQVAAPCEVVFRQDPSVYDGQFANNAWLQELPKPLSRLTWGNAAIVSPATARRLVPGEVLRNWPGTTAGEHGRVYGDVIEIAFRGRKPLALPVWIQAGHPDDTITLHLGHGRPRGGRVAEGIGEDVAPLRTSDAFWIAPGAAVRKTGKTAALACVQFHQMMEGRDLVREGTISQFQDRPAAVTASPHHGEGDPDAPLPSLYPGHAYDGYRWAMAIDVAACVGCQACVIACQAENNIPVVGRQEVLRGREMHWIRVDQYFAGPEGEHAWPPAASPERPTEAFFQPVPCMHCENAPCEVVCPVAATAHSSDGLNDMVYNRCVGTRYCANNCPYKVRRFNYFQYSDVATEPLQLLHNPDVTVRSRGVMEKCTYCVQRIRQAEIAAEKEGRRIRDGEVQTACQAVCPAQAITFGDLNTPGGSEVRRWREESRRNYGLLAEVNTQPRTTYLAAIRNPNPELHNV
jgi:molybdopterin-containing oxidoreductase family iron-sulfur binding subunit